jgi:hypothetical protein
MASAASRSFRPQVRFGVSKRFFTSCCVSVLPPLGQLAAADVHPDRPAHGAKVDARVLVEAMILRRQHGLDEVPRHRREGHRVAKLVGRSAEPREDLRLELELRERLAGRRGELADAPAVDRDSDPQGRARHPWIVEGAQLQVPGVRLATELTGRGRGRLGLAIPQPPESPREVGGFDRDAGRQHLAGREDDGGLLQPREIDARGGPPRPHAERDRRSRDRDDR